MSKITTGLVLGIRADRHRGLRQEARRQHDSARAVGNRPGRRAKATATRSRRPSTSSSAVKWRATRAFAFDQYDIDPQARAILDARRSG